MSTDRGLIIEATIGLRPAEGEAWDQQLKLVRASGASYETRTKIWRLRTADLDTALARLGCLAQAADRYGTTVSLRVVKAPEEWGGEVIVPLASGV